MNDETRFLVDENLLGLVKWLRMMGVDAAVVMGASDDDLLAKAQAENRVLLTKDRRFYERIPGHLRYFVSKEIPKEQLLEVLERFGTPSEDEELTRCFNCNTPIEEVDKESIRDLVDAKTFHLYDKFYQCPTCKKIYWEGSHYHKMQKEIAQLKADLNRHRS